MEVSTRRVGFTGAFGDRLAARIEMPPGEPIGVALFAHCFACSKDYKALVRISRALAERSFAVCRFDFTGLGESQGDFAETNFSSSLGDLLAAAEFLRGELGGPQILIGHSLGGAAVLAVARRVASVRAVATIAAPSDTSHLSDSLLGLVPDLANEQEAAIEIGGRTVRVKRQLLEDLDRHHMKEYIVRLDRPLLVVHSPQDETVAIEHAERIFQRASYPKSLVTVEGADHLLSRRERDSRFVADILAVWSRRYL